MLNKIQNDLRQKIIFFSMGFMLVSLFLSRGMLSISLISFVIISLFHKHVGAQFRRFLSSPILWGMSLLYFLPLVSGLWSADKESWLNIMRIKAPLFFLPLAFAMPLNFSNKDWERLAFIFLLLVTGASFWSMWQYVIDMEGIHKGYLHAKVIRTPLDDDHIRFSWIVSMAILLACWQFILKRKTESKIILCFLIIMIAWLTIYLHILAARTGLLCFYAMLLISAGWFLIKRSKPILSMMIVVLVIVLPFVSYFIFPTFQNRIKYIIYDASYFRNSSYLPGSVDGSRYFSIKAGIDILKQNPVIGVGFGDIRKETNAWYAARVPQMLEKDKLIPSSEWLLYGDGCGWLGMLIFTFVMLIPFFIRNHCAQIVWLLLNVSATLTFIFDVGLEVQYGVFLYCFIVLWMWKWLQLLKTF